MKKLILASAIASAFAGQVAYAADAAPAATPEHAVAINVGVVSDYRYRGISQSRLKPALQGGVDLAGPNGLYAGAWASTIKWVKDGGGGADEFLADHPRGKHVLRSGRPFGRKVARLAATAAGVGASFSRPTTT
jgi:uncharacterized protein (TIGR02001 family)